MYVSSCTNNVVLSGGSECPEQLWLKLTVSGKVIVACITYRHPRENKLLFLKSLEEVLADLYSTYDNIISFGDFSVDMLESNCSATVQLLSLTNNFGLRQVITEPARVSEIRLSLIDLIVSNIEQDFETQVINVGVADYF